MCAAHGMLSGMYMSMVCAQRVRPAIHSAMLTRLGARAAQLEDENRARAERGMAHVSLPIMPADMKVHLRARPPAIPRSLLFCAPSSRESDLLRRSLPPRPPHPDSTRPYRSHSSTVGFLQLFHAAPLLTPIPALRARRSWTCSAATRTRRWRSAPTTPSTSAPSSPPSPPSTPPPPPGPLAAATEPARPLGPVSRRPCVPSARSPHLVPPAMAGGTV